MSSLQRTDPELVKDLRDVAGIRVTKKFLQAKPKDVSLRNMQRLLRRTEGYKMALEELKTKPEKR